jgi:hypothetical protein
VITAGTTGMASDKIYTVGELRERLSEYDKNTHVRVNDDMMRFPPRFDYDEETDTVVL